MFTRLEIEKQVAVYVSGKKYIDHISDMLEEIQRYLYSRIKCDLFYTSDKYTKDRAGIRASKFQESCSNEDWDRALSIADYINKEILTATNIYQQFVKDVKNSTEYTSIYRDKKLKNLLV